MKKSLIHVLSLLLTAVYFAGAQDRPKIKFGSVKAEDFKTTVYDLDTSAAAVVIADIGSTEIVGNNKGSFSLEFKNYRRAHILKKSGYDIGDVEINLYTSSAGNAEEQLNNLKAVTYNLENGKVVETKLDVKSAVFKDKINKNLTIRKFTFPNIKEDSIIEYEYKIMSDFVFNLQPWEFQGQYPRLWSEYNVAMPEFYNYVTLTQGYHAYAVKEQKNRRSNFTMAETRGAGGTDRANFSANVTDYRWAMKDVPALKLENFTSTLRNHISKIEFQLQAIRDPFPYRPIMGTWASVTKDLMNDEDFGLQLTKDNGWLGDATQDAVGNASTFTDKARNIYYWVRDHFTCTSTSARYLQKSLRNILKDKNGNVAEINILLIAMLRKAGINADPVLLSTRSHGYSHAIYPLIDRMNYVVCRIETDGKEYYLDASRPRLGFGKLGTDCYNGHARIINEAATSVDLTPESVKESKMTTIFMINSEEGKWIGSLQQVPGYYESYRIRNNLKESNTGQLAKEIVKGFGLEISTAKERVDSLEKFEEPVGVFFEFDVAQPEEDILYVNPMFGMGYKENPFKSAERFYPVEMPYTIDEFYTLQMEVPSGYVLDELPKQAIVKFNEEEDAVFEYRISESAGTVSLRSRIRVKRAWFDPEEYEILREFFNFVVKKQNEQIVFKKKK